MAVMGIEVDRRRHVRSAAADVPLTAVVFMRDVAVGRFIVQNLSAGGALLTGRRDVPLDERVRVMLPLPGRDPLVVDGRVARRADAGNEIVALAVQFRHKSPRTEDEIHEALASELLRISRVEQRSALVVQDSPELCGRLQRDLEQMGYQVHLARTPLDVVRVLEDPQIGVDVAFVDVSAGEVDGLALLRFLRDEHPGVRRVLVQGAVRPSVAELMETASFVHRVLAEPWDRSVLNDTLGEG